MEKMRDLIITSAYWYLIPILLFNIFFAQKLTEVGYLVESNGIGFLRFVELIFRVSIWALPFFIFIDYSNPNFKLYLTLFIIGMSLYFISWLLIIYLPTSPIALTWLVKLGPAYLTVFWLIPLSLMSKNGHWFILVSVVFGVIHTVSTYINLRG